MATSPLFGWEEPDDTDLVKDGAAAIRTLGNAIDTSMGDLLGGTTGQVLSKASNTNMDFTWVTSDDANAIQNTIVDAKGDLIAASASDTPARLAVGATNTFLRPNASAATGLEWVDGATTWTPTYSNLTIGNGTVTAKYTRVGKMVTAFFALTFGSTTAITANYASFTLPFTPVTGGLLAGFGHYEDAGVADYYGGFYFGGATVFPTRALTGAWNGIDATAPFTWATNDKISVSITFEAA
jgi:hypothetical protein